MTACHKSRKVPAPLKDHCVIGLEAFQRTWGSEKESQVHAATILKNQPGVQRFAIVKLVSIVERTEPPVRVRKPRPADTERTA